MGAEVGNLPGLGAFSHLGGSAFGATAHDAVHDAFMTLPHHTRTREGEVQPGGTDRSRSLFSLAETPFIKLVNDYSKDDFCSTKEEYLCVKYLVYK